MEFCTGTPYLTHKDRFNLVHIDLYFTTMVSLNLFNAVFEVIMLTSEQSRHFNPAKFLEGNAFTNKKEEVTNLLRAQPKRFSQDLDKEKEDLTVFGNEMLNNANNRKDSLDNNINSIKSQTAEEYKLNILKFSLDSRLDQIKNSAEIKNFLQ